MTSGVKKRKEEDVIGEKEEMGRNETK